MAIRPETLSAVLTTGKNGMVNHENRLLAEPSHLFDAQEVTFEDRHVRKGAGVSMFGRAGLPGAAAYEATLSSSTFWTAHGHAFQGTTTPAFVKSLTGTATTASGNTVEITIPAGGVTAGRSIVVAVGWAGLLITGTTATCTDAAGNTYSLITDISNVPISTYMFVCPSALALTAGQKITVTFSRTGAIARAAVAAEFNAGGGFTDTAFGFSYGAATNVLANLGNFLTLPQMVVGATATNGSTVTPTAGFTEIVESTATGISVSIAYRLDTTTPRITAMHQWHSGQETSGGATTASTTAGSTTVTGGGGTTWFAGPQYIRPGDSIRVISGGDVEERIVSVVNSDTSLTVTVPFEQTMAAASYYYIAGPRLITAATSGNLFKEIDGTPGYTNMAAGLARSFGYGKFIVGGKEDGSIERKLFYLNGKDPVKVLVGDGATMTSIAAPASDWSVAGRRPINGTVHNGRLALIGSLRDPHRIYYSDPTDHSNFTSAASITGRVRSDVGDRLFGIVSFQGVLWLWKHPFGIFYIDDSDLDPANWVERTKSTALGCAPSPHAVLATDDDIMFMAASGDFHLLSAVSDLGGTRASNLTWHFGLTKWVRDHVNLGRLDLVHSVWYPHKKQAIWFVPSAGSTTADLRLVWDFSGVEYGEPAKFSWSERDASSALCLIRESDGVYRPAFANGGLVYMLDRDARVKNSSEAYTSSYTLPHIDFAFMDPSLGTKRKRFEALELVMEPVAAGTLTVNVVVDGTVRETLTFDATKRRERKTLHCGDGYTFQLIVTNAAASEDFKVLSHVVWFQLSNEDGNR